MRAAAGGSRVVVPSDESGDGFRELRRERGAIGRRSESDFRVDGQRREVFALFLRAAEEIPDLAHDACGQSDEVPRRKPIGGPLRSGAS